MLPPVNFNVYNVFAENNYCFILVYEKELIKFINLSPHSTSTCACPPLAPTQILRSTVNSCYCRHNQYNNTIILFAFPFEIRLQEIYIYIFSYVFIKARACNSRV